MKKTLLTMLALAGVFGMASAQDVNKGTAENPLTIEELKENYYPNKGEGEAGWYVTGYIVGWIDGMSYKTGAKFELPAGVATNLILGPSSSETDPNECIAIKLASGDVRNKLNLVDNPENMYHQITLCGTYEKYFGTAGLIDITKWEWVGDAPVHQDPNYGPEVTGTAEKPLTVDEFFAAASAGTSIPNTYVKGVIVGYIPGMVFDEGVLGATGEVSETNVLIAATSEPASLEDCIPVQLPKGSVRDGVNLKANPGNLGKTVTFCGTHTNYFNVSGLKEVLAYSFGDDPIDVPDTPVTPGSGFYTGLVNNAEGWQFDNVSLSEGITYVWKWDEQYKNLYGSAYVKTPHAAESYAYVALDLTSLSSVTASFDHAAKFQTILRESCKFVAREQGATEWKEFAIPTWPEAGAWTFVNSGEINLNEYAGKKIEVGFKYLSTNENADSWEIKNFVLDGNKSGVAQVVADLGVRVEGRNIVAPADAQVYTINGTKSGRNDLAKGLYIVVCGKQAAKVVVK